MHNTVTPWISSQKEIKQDGVELPQNNIGALPSLGEALTKKKGNELVKSVSWGMEDSESLVGSIIML